jgi:hypothetical protein
MIMLSSPTVIFTVCTAQHNEQCRQNVQVAAVVVLPLVAAEASPEADEAAVHDKKVWRNSL